MSDTIDSTVAGGASDGSRVSNVGEYAEGRIIERRKLFGKISPRSIFSCTNIHKIMDIIISEIRPNSSGMNRLFFCMIGEIRFLTKFCIYTKTSAEIYGKTNNQPSIDAEIGILFKLRDHVIIPGYSPSVLEVLYEMTCDDIGKLAPSQRVCDQFNKGLRSEYASIDEGLRAFLCGAREFVDAKLAYNKCAFIVLDRCDIEFSVYIMQGISSPVEVAVFRSILFMIIHAIYAIGRIFPTFKHGDLHTGNIMIKYNSRSTFSLASPEFRLVIIGDKKFYVPYFGMTPKIIDYDRASLPEEHIVSAITDNPGERHDSIDQDLLVFFHYIYVMLPHKHPGERIVETILEELEPTGAYKQLNYSYIRRTADKIKTPYDMLMSRVFADYLHKNEPAGKIISTHPDPPVGGRAPTPTNLWNPAK